MVPDRADFTLPNFDAPLDVEEYARLVPDGATIKGMFMSALLQPLGAKRDQLASGRAKYIPFKDYPLTEQVQLLAEVARVLYPELPQRQALRQIGHRIFPEFSNSLIGRILFATVGRDPEAMVKAGNRAYAMSASVGSFEVIESSPNSAVIYLREIYNYIDCYQVGVLEGAFRVLSLRPTINVKLESLTSGWFSVDW